MVAMLMLKGKRWAGIRLRRTHGHTRRLHIVVREGGHLCCSRSTPRLRSFRCSTLGQRLGTLRTRFPRLVATGSPARGINNAPDKHFTGIARIMGVRDLLSTFSCSRLHSFSHQIQSTKVRPRCIIRVGVSNLSYDLRCRGNMLIHTSAHNSNIINRSIATGIGTVGHVPGALGGTPRCLRIHNRICVPRSTFRRLYTRRRLRNTTPFGGPHGTTTKSLHRGSSGVANDQKLSVFMFGIRRIQNERLADRTRDLSCLGDLNVPISPHCRVIRSVRSTVTRVRRVNRGHTTLSFSVSNTIVGIGGFTRQRLLNSAGGFPH